MARAPMMDDSMAGGPALEDEGGNEAMTDMGEATEDESGQVVCTILKDADGRFRVIAGDEPEPGNDMMDGDEGESFEGIGKTLERVMAVLQQAEAGQGQAAFDDGFNGAPV